MTDLAASPARPGRFAKIARSVGLLRESPIGMVGLTLVLFWVLIAIFADLLPLRDPLAQAGADLLTPALTPSPDGGHYWLGTDDKGRDILARLFYGSRLVLFWSGFATVVAYAVGMLMGVAAGYRGGWWDEIISFIGNVFLAFPQMVLYIVILSQLGPDSSAGQWLAGEGFSTVWVKGLTIVLAVMFATAPQVARIVRGLVLDLKTRDYVAAAEVRGETPIYIMIVELLPNARGPLIVDACLRLGYVTIAIAALGFLGLGLPPPDPDWGKMISEVRGYGTAAANAMIWPALAISTMVLGLNLLADGLREISLRD
ncbi:MAG: ABC transporter permease [Rhizobiales bacterium]|nr:ABC transporter permease [Hyphomicrobiales bacterium]MBI3673392.1 ABC transporter permease [Hyphomicrobiales bacterium]